MVSEKYKEYYVNNTTNDPQIVTLYLYNECDNAAAPTQVEGFSQTVPANTESKINFPADGTYSVVIDGDTANGSIAKYYLTLFESFVTYTSAALCGDGNCLEESGAINNSYVWNALSKAIYYMAVNDLKYTGDIEEIMANIKCSAYTEWARITNQEAYLGQSNVEYLSQIELAHYYKKFYEVDLRTELAEGLRPLYDYDKINNCIAKLGIVDCGDTTPLPGTKHTTTLSASPSTLGLGVSTDITISYKFTANDDTFTAVIDTNIPNVSLNK